MCASSLPADAPPFFSTTGEMYQQAPYYLPPRYECIRCADCGGFTVIGNSELRSSPATPHSECLCGHSYLAHRTATASSAPVTGATATHIAPVLPSPLVPEAPPSHSNGLDPFAGNPFMSQSSSSINTVMQPPVQSSSSEPYVATLSFADDSIFKTPLPLSSPVAAFVQSSRPAAISRFHPEGAHSGTVTQQHTNSIGRMNTAAGPQSPRRTSVNHASVGFGTTSRLGTDPLQSLPPPGNLKYLVCVPPFTLRETSQSEFFITPVYQFTTTVQLPAILRALTTHGLVTPFIEREGRSDSFWAQLDTSIRQHLTDSGIILAFHSQHPPPYGFEYAAWEVVGARSAQPGHKRKLTSMGLLERDFTHAKLLPVTKRIRHPSEEGIRILFVAPTWDHLQGPLSALEKHEPVHPCFPLRVFERTGLLDFNENEIIDCLEECPTSEVLGAVTGSKRRAPTPENPAKRQKSDLALGETESVGVKPEPIVNLVDSDSESDHDSDMVEVLEASPMATVQQLIDAAGTAPIQYLPPNEVLALRTAVVVAPGDQDDLNSLEVSGPTVEAVATTLLAFVGHYHRQPDSLDAFVPDEDSGVNLHTPDFPAGFFHAGRSYTIYFDPESPDEGANSHGPERAVYVAGLECRLKDGSRWAKSSGQYFRPQFHRLPDIRKPDRIHNYMVDGTWAALFLISLGGLGWRSDLGVHQCGGP
ncbi:hypothetical protein K438DRAFT_691364 [Mycena galopus ATCC 62051]|nr:hypothetical protein K438DRAFT_691364 [Mycena galopus ATCC 62051]